MITLEEGATTRHQDPGSLFNLKREQHVSLMCDFTYSLFMSIMTVGLLLHLTRVMKKEEMEKHSRPNNGSQSKWQGFKNKQIPEKTDAKKKDTN